MFKLFKKEKVVTPLLESKWELELEETLHSGCRSETYSDAKGAKLRLFFNEKGALVKESSWTVKEYEGVTYVFPGE